MSPHFGGQARSIMAIGCEEDNQSILLPRQLSRKIGRGVCSLFSQR
jgi:hypothetical protein